MVVKLTCSPALCIVVGQPVAAIVAAAGPAPPLPAAASAAAEVQALSKPRGLRRQPLGFDAGNLQEHSATSAVICLVHLVLPTRHCL